jgi:signal transduction histidine kinase
MQLRRFALPYAIAVLLLITPALHILALHIVGLDNPFVVTIQLLRPIVTLSGMLFLLWVGLNMRRTRRWTWFLLALTHAFAALFSYIKIVHNVTVELPFMNILWMVIYFFGFLSAAIALNPYDYKIGTSVRVVMASIIVTFSVYIVLTGILPRVFAMYPWQPNHFHYIINIAFDIGILFAISVKTINLRGKTDKVLYLLFVSFCCVLFADSLLLWLKWVPWGVQFEGPFFPIYPLYALYVAIGVFAAYCDLVDRPPSLSTSFEQPLFEWILWTFVPPLFALLALTSIQLFAINAQSLLTLLIIAVISYEIIAAYDYWRVHHALRVAHAKEAQARRLVRFLEHELHDRVKELKGATDILWEILDPHRGQYFDVEPEELLAQSDEIIEDLHTLLQQLLILSNDGTPIVKRQYIAVKPLCERAKKRVQATLLRTCPNVSIIVQATDNLIACGDELFIELALTTSLRNAIEGLARKPTHENDQIIVSATQEGNRIILRVDDTGLGFTSEMLKKLGIARMPDGHLSTGESSKPGGHGIGLALIDRVATMHNGFCKFGNRSDSGAWIVFDVPCWSQVTVPEAATFIQRDLVRE